MPLSTEKSTIPDPGGAKSGAPAQFGDLDPDLAWVVEAWPTLPAAIRAGILAMVRGAEG